MHQRAGSPPPLPPGPRAAEDAPAPSGAIASSSSRRAAFLPPADAPPEAWRAVIAEHRQAGRIAALQAIAESRPGRDERERGRLVAEAVASIGAIRTEESRRALGDLLESPHREVRLAAMSVAYHALPAERGALLALWRADPDRVVRAKAAALESAVR